LDRPRFIADAEGDRGVMCRFTLTVEFNLCLAVQVGDHAL
jgi:hypothetical protein